MKPYVLKTCTCCPRPTTQKTFIRDIEPGVFDLVEWDGERHTARRLSDAECDELFPGLREAPGPP
jgi:hypothetical protein